MWIDRVVPFSVVFSGFNVTFAISIERLSFRVKKKKNRHNENIYNFIDLLAKIIGIF